MRHATRNGLIIVTLLGLALLAILPVLCVDGYNLYREVGPPTPGDYWREDSNTMRRERGSGGEYIIDRKRLWLRVFSVRVYCGIFVISKMETWDDEAMRRFWDAHPELTRFRPGDRAEPQAFGKVPWGVVVVPDVRLEREKPSGSSGGL